MLLTAIGPDFDNRSSFSHSATNLDHDCCVGADSRLQQQRRRQRDDYAASYRPFEHGHARFISDGNGQRAQQLPCAD
jgi:hypothetical protein